MGIRQGLIFVTNEVVPNIRQIIFPVALEGYRQGVDLGATERPMKRVGERGPKPARGPLELGRVVIGSLITRSPVKQKSLERIGRGAERLPNARQRISVDQVVPWVAVPSVTKKGKKYASRDKGHGIILTDVSRWV